MLNTIRNYIEKYEMIKQKDHILIGVSGGADSICLFDILYRLREEYQLTLTVVHIEHGVRGEDSLADMEYVKAICAKRNVMCICEQHDMPKVAKEQGLSEEEAGRMIRYEAFLRIANEIGAHRIAVAHHGNDLAETMLFFLSRGTSLAGLAPIRPVRGNIIRPLLCVERQDIERYLKEQGLDYCVDKTNDEIKYSRNLIRHHVIPELNKINTQSVAHFMDMQENYLMAEEVLQDVVCGAWNTYVECKEDVILFPNTLFLECRRYVRLEVIKKGIIKLAGRWKDMQKTHLEQMDHLFMLQVGRKIMLPYGIIAVRTYDGVELGYRKESGEKNPGKVTGTPVFACEVSVPCTLELNDGRILETRFVQEEAEKELFPVKTYTKWFDYDIIKNSLYIRHVLPDDYIVIDSNGGRKKIKKLLVDMKIPREERSKIMVLASGNEVFWAIGLRMGERAKVNQFTDKIIEITIHGGESNERNSKSTD